MKFTRRYSRAGIPVVDQVEWKTVEARIEDSTTGELIFSQSEVVVPERWSQTAANILAQKYFRKAGVPNKTDFVTNDGMRINLPKWLRRSVHAQGSEYVAETSAQQVFHRMTGCWTYWGWKSGLFCGDEEQAQIFYDELYMMLALQIAAPNSPQWFNTGLHWAYGIEGPDAGQWVCDGDQPQRVTNSYSRPQPHACFLTPIADDLVNDGGIMDAWVREARIFKYGSGSGINVSQIRANGEPLSGGGKASGVMSWLRIADRSAGAIASGGTTRRAATMRILDVDHPEIENFIDWKVREEAKAAAMYVGSQLIKNVHDFGSDQTNSRITVPDAIIDRISNEFDAEIFNVGWEGEAIETVSGQNSNNSIRVPDAFMQAVDENTQWNLTARTTCEVVKSIRARDLWDRACRAAWACADPGVLFADNINAWNTCAADGEITTTNPCSEFHHLCGTEYGSSACNLASLRLSAFLKPGVPIADELSDFRHVVSLWTCVLDISVTMASYPAKEFALGAYNYRTLGLGYMDLGGLLARLNIRYDSEEGRSLAAAMTALMTGVAYETSQHLARLLGTFPRFTANEQSFRRVMQKHREAVMNISCPGMVGAVVARALDVWNNVCEEFGGFRNAQTTLLAPTGTISLVTDSQTSGIEPFFSRSSTKSLAGGGTLEFVFDVPKEDTAMHLEPLAHVKMMAAVQPSLSGAISKTVNLPRSAMVSDVDHIYRSGHRLGLKAMAVYRDGSKLSQPLREKIVESAPGTKNGGVIPPAPPPPLVLAAERVVPSDGVSELLMRGAHEYLPWRRERGYTQKAKISDQTVFWRVSEYPDGRPGEIFIELAHEGSTLRATANCVAIAISVSLQHGVPLASIVDKYLGTKFEPAGYVEGHERIRFATSFTDLIARDLAITYLGREDLANVVRPVNTETLEQSAVALDKRAIATASGRMTGELCRVCGGLLIQTGTCLTCQSCGWNEGCG